MEGFWKAKVFLRLLFRINPDENTQKWLSQLRESHTYLFFFILSE